MLTKPWGAAFTLTYYPQLDGEPFDPPAQTPSIYVFDRRPSASDIDNGTDAIGVEITTWGEGTANERTITIPAIADPADSTFEKFYYVGLKYVAATGGTATYDVAIFKLVRPIGATLDATPTAQELKDIDSTLATYYPTDADITTQIGVAETELKIEFLAMDVIWELIKNPENLSECIKYKALTGLFLDKRKVAGDTFDLKVTRYGNMAEMLKDSIKLEYDANEDQQIDESEENKPTNPISFSR